MWNLDLRGLPGGIRKGEADLLDLEFEGGNLLGGSGARTLAGWAQSFIETGKAHGKFRELKAGAGIGAGIRSGGGRLCGELRSESGQLVDQVLKSGWAELQDQIGDLIESLDLVVAEAEAGKLGIHRLERILV